jgi:hypothetical protein
MIAERQPDMAIVLDDFAAGRHRSQRDDRLMDFRHGFALAGRGRGEERQRLVAQRLDRPKGVATGEWERGPVSTRKLLRMSVGS